MKMLSLLGRLMFGGFFIMAGLRNFTDWQTSADYAAGKGVPMPTVAVMVSGFLILAGGVLVLLGYKVRLGAFLIVLFLIPASIIMHDFWADIDPAMKQMNLGHFMKNMALAGAALMIATPRRWPLSLEREPPPTPAL